MTDLQDPQLETDATGPEIAAGGGSVLSRVKKRRSNKKDELDLDVPSWGGELVATYKTLDIGDIEAMVKRIVARQRGQKKIGKGDQPSLGSGPDLNFLIKACIGVTAVDAESGEEEFLTPGYTMDLAAMLDPKDEFDNPIVIETPPELLAYLMKNNSISIAAHSQKVARWMQDTSKPVEDPQ